MCQKYLVARSTLHWCLINTQYTCRDEQCNSEEMPLN